jgi:hypothetical protein
MTIEHLKSVLAHVSQTDQNYRSLYNPSIVTHPIPFFGNLESATILTVGVNPSDAEFASGRWPDKIPPEALHGRLKNYFSLERPKPHPFFKPWSDAFEHLAADLSYANGKAAHLDLSPRATEFPRKHQKEDEWTDWFLKMLWYDAELFFKALKFSKNVKLILVAGTATKRHYIASFIKEQSERHGFCLEFQAFGKGKKTSFYVLKNRDGKLNLPLFSSGASPAFKNGARLIENIRLNGTKLASYLS